MYQIREKGLIYSFIGIDACLEPGKRKIFIIALSVEIIYRGNHIETDKQKLCFLELESNALHLMK